jgi:hypothetical protein
MNSWCLSRGGTVVVVEAMVLAVIAPFALGTSPPSSPALLGTSLDAPIASAPVHLASCSLDVAASASELQPLDQSQPVEDSEDSSQVAVI